MAASLTPQLCGAGDRASYLDWLAVQAPRSGGATGYAPRLDWVPGCAPWLCSLPRCCPRLFSNQAGPYAQLCHWGRLLAGSISCLGSLFRLMFYVGPEAIFNYWARLFAWLPACVGHRICSEAAGHVWSHLLNVMLSSWAGL